MKYDDNESIPINQARVIINIRIQFPFDKYSYEVMLSLKQQSPGTVVAWQCLLKEDR